MVAAALRLIEAAPGPCAGAGFDGFAK